jgi:probable HAF family extracellular repeat protein
MFALNKAKRNRPSSSSSVSRSRRLRFESMEPRILLSHKAGHEPPGGGGGGGGEPEVTYTVVQLGTLGGSESRAYDVNDTNQVVGWSSNAGAQDRAFLWEDVNGNDLSDAGEMIDLGTLGGGGSRALAVNNAGQVVGSADTATGELRAFLWQDLNGNRVSDPGEMLNLGTHDGLASASEAFGVNALGWVVGWSYYRVDPSDPGSDGGQHAFLIVPDMSDSDGDGNPWFAADADGGNALMIDLGTLPTQPGAGNTDQSLAWGVNNAGDVVGSAYTIGANDSSNRAHAFLVRPENGQWYRNDDADPSTNELMIDLDTLAGGRESGARAVNNSGQIAGGARDDRGNLHAALWEVDSQGTITLSDLGRIKRLDNTSASDVNDASQVIGYGTKAGRNFSADPSNTVVEVEPFLWQNGTMTMLETLVTDMGGFNDLDQVLAINNFGAIVGNERVGDTNNDPPLAFIAIPSASGGSSSSNSTTFIAAESAAAGFTMVTPDDSSDVVAVNAIAAPLPTTDTGSASSAGSQPEATGEVEAATVDETIADFDTDLLEDTLLEDLAIALLGRDGQT